MKRYMCILLSIIISISCSGCIEKKKSSLNTRSYIVYNIGGLPEDLFMTKDPEIRKLDLLAAVFEGLVKVDESGNICKGIAETWDISEDKLTYTFKIRNDAKWSDGSSITAMDFVNFFSYILSKEVNCSYAEELNCIFGVSDYKKGKGTFEDVAITALDNSNLSIRLNHPCSYLLDILSQPEFSLRKDNELLRDWKKSYKEIKYSGPFQIENVTKKNEVTIVKNLNYWNKGEVKSDMLILTSINSNEMALATLETSKVDIMFDPPLSEIGRLKSEKKLITNFTQKGAALKFNMDKNNISEDIDFRKAMYYGVDRNKINDEIFCGINIPATSYIPRENSNIDFNKLGDIKKAKKYLENSKYNKENIVLAYLNTAYNKRVCEDIAKNLKKELNINIKATGYESNEFNDVVYKKEYDLIFDEYSGKYDDDTAYLEKWRSVYNNNKFHELVGKSKITKEESKRKELLKDAEKLLIDDAVLVPLYFENTMLVKRKEVEGLYITKRGNICLEKVTLSLNRAYVRKEPCIIKNTGIYVNF